MHEELVSIPIEQLDDVAGGNLYKAGQRLHKWWTKKGPKGGASRKELFDETINVMKGAGIGMGIGYGGKAIWDYFSGGGTKPQDAGDAGGETGGEAGGEAGGVE